MKLVVDANIIISALIKEGKTAEALVNPSLSLYKQVSEWNDVYSFLQS